MICNDDIIYLPTLSDNCITTGVISKTTVTLSKKAETKAVIKHSVVSNGQT